jgi:hypothetical protein
MHEVASAYLARLEGGETTDSAALLSAPRNLCPLAAAGNG